MRSRNPKVPLAPLAPSSFLRWLWERHPQIVRAHGYTGMVSPTLDSVLWDLQVSLPDYSMADFRRLLIHMAALVRYNQRLKREPFAMHVRTVKVRPCASAA